MEASLFAGLKTSTLAGANRGAWSGKGTGTPA